MNNDSPKYFPPLHQRADQAPDLEGPLRMPSLPAPERGRFEVRLGPIQQAIANFELAREKREHGMRLFRIVLSEAASVQEVRHREAGAVERARIHAQGAAARHEVYQSIRKGQDAARLQDQRQIGAALLSAAKETARTLADFDAALAAGQITQQEFDEAKSVLAQVSAASRHYATAELSRMWDASEAHLQVAVTVPKPDGEGR